MNDVDRMTDAEFADCLEDMFLDLGYDVERTRSRADRDKVLVLADDDFKTAVRAEQRTSNRVGSQAIQDVVAAQEKYKCEGTLVVTNQEYTPKARAMADVNDVVLWNRDAFAQMLQDSRHNPEPELETHQRAA